MIEDVVIVTDAATDYIKGLLTETKKPYLFLGVKGGGCAGFEYYWELMTPEDIKSLGTEDLDERIALGDGHRLIVDHMSLSHLKGSVIDYKVSIDGSRLVVENPQASGGCGCGSSVSFS